MGEETEVNLTPRAPKAWKELEEWVEVNVPDAQKFDVFAPNFPDYFAGLGPLGFIDVISRAFAIARGGIGAASLWVVTKKRLYIFRLGHKANFRWRVRNKVGDWPLDKIHAEPVKAKGMGKLHRPYAMKVRIDQGPHFEVQATILDETSADVVDRLLRN